VDQDPSDITMPIPITSLLHMPMTVMGDYLRREQGLVGKDKDEDNDSDSSDEEENEE
jgi:hypothetical protein